MIYQVTIIIIIIILLSIIIVKNSPKNSVCEGETEVFWEMVVLYFSSEDQYLFKKCFLGSAWIFGCLCSAGLTFENVFLKLL